MRFDVFRAGRPLPWWAMVAAVSLWFLLVLNASFLRTIWQVLPEPSRHNPLTLLALPLLVSGLLFAFFILFSARWFLRPVFSLFLVVGALVHLAAWKYGVLFNADMLRNILQTHASEVHAYFSWSGLLQFLLLTVPAIGFLWWVPIRYPSTWRQGLVLRLSACMLSLLLTAGWGWANYLTLASVGRNHPQLNRQINPLSWVQASIKLLREKTTRNAPLEHVAVDAQRTIHAGDKPVLMLLVVGETARAANYPQYGYRRNTTPFTQKFPLMAIPDVTSCGTATAISVPCMFSDLGRAQFSVSAAAQRENVLDVLARTGVQILWEDNDHGCKGVCQRVPQENYFEHPESRGCAGEDCTDDVMFDNLDHHLRAASDGQLIVWHLNGSHGPTYYQRYPAADRLFTPDCARADIENCESQALINTYDNTIAHTDRVLAEAIAFLQSRTADFAPVLMYVSDHGESLGEHGLYLHGTPWSLAPSEQTHVPWMFWFSPEYLHQAGLDAACLPRAWAKKSHSHDELFHTLLGGFSVRTRAYDRALDVLAPCRVARHAEPSGV